MTTYVPPLEEILFSLEELAGLTEVAQLPGNEDVADDLIRAVLGEAGKVAEEVLAPLNKQGDLEGAKLIDGDVKTTEGWKDAYDTLVEGGWNGLVFGEEFGGMGLPWLINAALQEMLQSANMAFTLCPMLTQGAVEAIELYGTEEQKQAYLPKMTNGHWTGTMNLTEAQAGSDLAAIRTKAVKQGDHYLISGQKIFITYGDHDLTDNIVHLVLARTPDAPAGVKGISMFIVPKFLEDGTRNDAHCVSIEHKLGIHASPTAVMSYGDHGGAVGYLVGEECKGLVYMFTMMNRARLNVGIQGLGIAERAYQQAAAYARDRVQGKAPGAAEKGGIIQHPDVRRMLLTMKSKIEAMRAICYQTAAAIDVSHHSTDADQKDRYTGLLDFLTPIAKGWCTEIGNEVASLGIQVHGGMGFIEETGACQHFRDARITSIYEGTTGIQANDLIGRKLIREGGQTAQALLEEIGALPTELDAAGLDVLANGLRQAHSASVSATEWTLNEAVKDPALPGAAAVNYLMLWGYLLGGYHLAKGALIASEKIKSGEGDSGFYKARIDVARYFAAQHLPQVAAYSSAISIGSVEVMALDESRF